MRRWHGYIVVREQGRGRWLSDPLLQRQLGHALDAIALAPRADRPGERLALRICSRRREALVEGVFDAALADPQALIAALADGLRIEPVVLRRSLGVCVLGRGGSHDRSRRAALAHVARHLADWEAGDDWRR